MLMPATQLTIYIGVTQVCCCSTEWRKGRAEGDANAGLPPAVQGGAAARHCAAPQWWLGPGKPLRLWMLERGGESENFTISHCVYWV